MTKAKLHTIKQGIEEFEFNINGLRHVSGGYVYAEDIQVNEQNNTATCTIVIGDLDKEEKFRNCFYDLNKVLDTSFIDKSKSYHQRTPDNPQPIDISKIGLEL